MKRSHCHRCQRPQTACICRWISPVEHATEVLFLQHPMEVGHAKGSAQLLHLSLLHSRLAVGETFDEAELHALLHRPFEERQSDRQTSGTIQPVLLYPETTGSAPAIDATDITSTASQLRLVVLDGTWRKSSKMLHRNPLLLQLPRLALRHPPPSHYTIRKARRPDQLSTFEATCLALAELENNVEKFAPLLEAFEGFVAQQQSYAPPRPATN